jgi:hypothetical protein
MCPTERTVMHQAFGNASGAIRHDFDAHVLQGIFRKLAVVSDQRAPLRAFAEKFTLRYHLCFRNHLECLKSMTFPALVTRRLVFAASQKCSNDLKVDVIQEFKSATRLGNVTEEGKQRFWRTVRTACDERWERCRG